MTLEELLASMNRGEPLVAGSEEYELMHHYSDEARKITAILNSGYHDATETCEIMAALGGRPVPASLRIFPPFYTDFGKNTIFGENVFVNSCCCFQDQGGISIGDGCLLGHRVTIATINHGILPKDRHVHELAPVRLGRNVWVGSGACILPGVSIGDGSIIAAGAVVTRDVEPMSIVGGVPARFLRRVDQGKFICGSLYNSARG